MNYISPNTCKLKDKDYNFLNKEQEEKKDEFLDAFHSTIWMTYRKSFTSIIRPTIPKEQHYTTDAGWGCMLRSGQMLLANSIIRHLFNNTFSLKELSKENKKKYLLVLVEFMDNLKDSGAAFSVGNVVEKGFKYKMVPKDWYGPTIIVSILSELNNTYKPFNDFKTIVFVDGVIYKDQIISLREPINTWSSPLLVLIAFRLGISSIDPVNYEAIIRLLDIPQCTGMIGGQGRAALYFIGHQGSELIFLDPHVTQRAVDKVENLWAEHLSYHYSTPLKLSIDKIDTCICYGNTSLKFIRLLFKNPG
jgi:cysteine protease ATG4